MDNGNTTAAPWWTSRTVWTQAVGLAFGLATAVFGLDLGTKLGMDQAQIVAVIMSLIPLVTLFIRFTHPMPVLVASKAKAEEINRAAVGRPVAALCDMPDAKPKPGFTGSALKQSASKPKAKAKTKR